MKRRLRKGITRNENNKAKKEEENEEEKTRKNKTKATLKADKNGQKKYEIKNEKK